MWTKRTYENTVRVYQEVVGSFFENIKLDGELKYKEVQIRAEILKRDFTKRQMIILVFILNFSYFLGKEWALIPKLKDFAIAGISEKKIKNELTKMIEMNVIVWNKKENLFKIEEARFWEAPYISSFNDKRSSEIFFMNLSHAGIDSAPIIQKVQDIEA